MMIISTDQKKELERKGLKAGEILLQGGNVCCLKEKVKK